MTDAQKITEAELARLRELAEAATPGPWDAELDDGNGTVEVNAGTARTKWHDGGWGTQASSWVTTDRILERDDLWDEEWERAAADAEFIAAANPQTIIALLDAVKAQTEPPAGDVRRERVMFEALADRLGEHPQARNYEIADSGEYKTMLRGPLSVEILAEWLMPTIVALDVSPKKGQDQ